MLGTGSRDAGRAGVYGERERVAVPGEARAELWREPAQAPAILEQQARRSERAGRQDEHRRLDLPIDPVLEVGETDAPDAARSLRRLDAADLVQRVDLGAV